MNTSRRQPFFNRLYVRIWLAVVLAVAVLIFLVGWAWRESAERKLVDYSASPVVREVVVRNAAGEVVGTAIAAPRVPGMGAGTEFSVTLDKPLAAGEVMALQMPRARRMNPQTGEILAMALRRLRGKLDYSEVGFALLPELFTLRQLQDVHEAILGTPLNKPAFRRRMLDRGWLAPTGAREAGTSIRPAELYRFAKPL